METSAQGEEIDSKYFILEKIGSGGQANIFRVVKKGTDEEYAAKVFKKDNDFITNEINILQEVKQYHCPYIINIIDSGEGMVIRNNRITKERKYFIIEKEKYGNIYDYIFYKNQGLGEPCSKIIFQKILIGFQYLHKHNICHRDIKLENILLDENFSPKICDFGFACFNSSKLVFKCGTETYKPPEVNGITEYDGIKCDIFCLASILMFLTTGSNAFESPIRSDSVFKRIILNKEKSFWDKMDPKLKLKKEIVLSPEFKDLYWKMISYDPQKRPTIDEILKHPWFQEINDIKKNDLKRLKKLEEDIKNFFENLYPSVKEVLADKLDEDDKESMKASYNRSISNNKDKDEKVFNSNAKPKFLNSPMNIKYCINIKGNLEPVNFMNKLCKMIRDEFGILKCYINTDPEILKFNISILKETEKDENENEVKDKECNEEEGDNEDEEENNDIKMQIKLYKDSEKYILRFKETKGNRKDFLNKYEAISNLVIKLLKKNN